MLLVSCLVVREVCLLFAVCNVGCCSLIVVRCVPCVVRCSMFVGRKLAVCYSLLAFIVSCVLLIVS